MLPVAAVLPDCKAHPSLSNGFVTAGTVNSEDKLLCFITEHATPNVTTQTALRSLHLSVQSHTQDTNSYKSLLKVRAVKTRNGCTVRFI